MKLSYVFWSVLCLSLLFYSCQSRKGTVNGEAAIDLPEIMERESWLFLQPIALHHTLTIVVNRWDFNMN